MLGKADISIKDNTFRIPSSYNFDIMHGIPNQFKFKIDPSIESIEKIQKIHKRTIFESQRWRSALKSLGVIFLLIILAVLFFVTVYFLYANRQVKQQIAYKIQKKADRIIEKIYVEYANKNQSVTLRRQVKYSTQSLLIEVQVDCSLDPCERYYKITGEIFNEKFEKKKEKIWTRAIEKIKSLAVLVTSFSIIKCAASIIFDDNRSKSIAKKRDLRGLLFELLSLYKTTGWLKFLTICTACLMLV